MPLTSRQIDLLDEIVSQASETLEGLDAVRFRATHEDDLDNLDELERRHFLERKDTGRYFARIPALIAVSDRNTGAARALSLCERLFDTLRAAYKTNPGAQITLPDLAKTANLALSEMRPTIFYLFQAPIWSGYTADLTAPNAYVCPSEGILKYKTFDRVVDQMQKWTVQPVVPFGGNREKQQKFGILDSPTLLAGDLQQPSGVLGTSLIYLDIDDFKAVNTQLTEAVADELILPSVHQLLAKCVDPFGYAYGEGGDEFVIFLPNFSEAMATALAEDIRARIASAKFTSRATSLRLTASFGVAHANVGGDVSKLKHNANLATRFAKQHGKHVTAVWRATGCQLPSRQSYQTPAPNSPNDPHRLVSRDPNNDVEPIDKRIERIVKVLNLDQPDDGGVTYDVRKKKVTLQIPTDEGPFTLYFAIEADRIAEYWYISCQGDGLNIDRTLADIRVLLNSIRKVLIYDPDTTARFVVATNSDVSGKQKAIQTKFKKMKTIVDLPAKSNVRLELWDRSSLKAKETELGIRL